MNRKIIGVTVGTPMKPQKILDQIDLSNYYTKEEINVGFNGLAQVITENQIENKNTFATKEELENIDIPDVDLTNYYTKTEIDSKGYKTESEIKDIVNDVITEALNSEV